MKANQSIISRISAAVSRVENLTALYALFFVVVAVLGLVTLPSITYYDDQLYPKTIIPESSLNPYDRGGVPFETTPVKAQYPENSPYVGYVTTYLTPLSQWLADHTHHFGTTIVAHPGGIIDEILYNTRGLDTVVETSILFVAFGIASYLFRRDD
ncbi:MAG: EhaF family protein [Methanomicrobiales archaeon]|nr:EhaF family protein [Methanomicrobiales archaeon]